MALIRCKWFDEDGRPISGGCKASARSCGFVHPDDGDWKFAERRLTARKPGENPLKRKTPPSLSHKKAAMRRGSGSFTNERKPDFDESSWKAGPSKSTALEMHPPSDNGWGTPRAATTAGWDSGSTGWGTSTQDSSGWGSSTQEGSGWGSGTREDNGWDVDLTSLSTPTARIQVAEQRKIANKSRNNSFTVPSSVPDKKSAPLPRSRTTSVDLSSGSASDKHTLSDFFPTASVSKATRDPRAGSFTSESKGKQRELNRPSEIAIVTQTMRPRSIQPPSAGTPTLPTPTTPMAPPPLPSATRYMMPPPPTSASSTTSESKDLLAQARSRKRRGNLAKEMKAKMSIMQAGLTPEERLSVYCKVVKHIQCLVGLQIRLNKMKATEENWKRNRKSSFYAQSSYRAREKLEAGRKLAGERVNDLQKQRDLALIELISLPDIPTRSHRPYNVDLDKQKIVNYTLELKSWVEELDMPKRLTDLQIHHKQDGTSTDMAVDGALKGSPSPPPVVATLRQRKRITVDDINSAIEMLQHRITGAEENAYFGAFTVQDIDEATQKYRDAIKKKQMQKVSAAMDRQTKQLEIADSLLREQIGGTVAVRERLESLEAALKDLKQKTAAITAFNEESESAIQNAELKQRERREQLNELAEQLRVAIANKRARSVPRPVRDITIDDISPEIRQELVDRLKRELQPVLNGLIEGTRQAGELVKATVEKMVEPVVKGNAEIQSLSSMSASQLAI